MNAASLTGEPGRVIFVGAGPGAADLLTVRAVRALAQAEVVLHDALVEPEVLALAPQAHKIAVGKRAGRASTGQGYINRALVEAAANHRVVVRLKGGDPAVFARLEEETAALAAAGIAYEVVPGVSTAFAAAAELGVSLTQRGVARSLVLTTPRVGDDQPPQAWAAGLAGDATLAIYMAGREIGATARALLAAGRAADTPMVVLENVGRADRRRWVGSLLDAALLAVEVGAGPVLLLAGEALRGVAPESVARALEFADEV